MKKNQHDDMEAMIEQALAAADLDSLEGGVELPTADIDGLDLGDGEPGEGEGMDPEDLGTEPSLEGEEIDLPEPEPEFEGGDEGAGDFADEDEDEFAEDRSEVDEDAPVVAFSVLASEIDEMETKQGLNSLPVGVTASTGAARSEALVAHLLATGAIYEIKLSNPISEKARATREAAFAGVDEAELFAIAEELQDIADEPALEGPETMEADDLEMAEGLEGDIDLEGMAADGDIPAEPSEPVEPAPVEEPVAPVEEPATASVNFHPVADAEMIATASTRDVQLVLSAGHDPRWNVIIAGVPAAVIAFSSLQAQTGAPNEAIASFQTQDWSNSVLSRMAQTSVASVLEDLGAEYYANAFETAEVVQQAHASAQEALASEFSAKVVGIRDSLVDFGSVAIAGYAKGYYKDVNPLQAHATQVLAAAGVMNPELVALEICQALPNAFEAAMVKASDYMAKSPEFVEELRASIDEMQPRVRTEASVAVAATRQPLAARLAGHTMTTASVGAAPAAQPTQAVAGTGAYEDMRARMAARVGRLGARR